MPRSSSPRRNSSWVKYLAGGILLVPAMAGSTVLARHLLRFDLRDPAQAAFVVGAGVYLVMHLLLWKPIFMHVMGHELTHAFWAVLLGGRIKSLQISQAGGQVTLSKSNFFIALAPYFFPLYTFLLLPIYFISIPKYQPVLAFLIGFTLAFHVALTLHSLRDRQSDLREVGLFFSLIFVYSMNLCVLVVVVAVVAAPVITPAVFIRETWISLAQIAAWATEWLSASGGTARK